MYQKTLFFTRPALLFNGWYQIMVKKHCLVLPDVLQVVKVFWCLLKYVIVHSIAYIRATQKVVHHRWSWHKTFSLQLLIVRSWGSTTLARARALTQCAQWVGVGGKVKADASIMQLSRRKAWVCLLFFKPFIPHTVRQFQALKMLSHVCVFKYLLTTKNITSSPADKKYGSTLPTN